MLSMKDKASKKKNFLKKKFIQICRILGFEIIDQGLYEVSTAEKKIHETLSVVGCESITVPTGSFKVSRKAKNLNIILRTCMLDAMLAQKKKRLFEDKKIEYTLRCLQSIINSVDFFYTKQNNNFDINITILDTRSNNDQINILKNFIEKKNYQIDFKITDMNKYTDKIKDINSISMQSFMSNLYHSLELGKNGNSDLVFYVDDDYILKKECIHELILSYEKFSSIIKREIFLCPADYPYLYFQPENTYILLGEKYHWRRIKESLCMFLTSKELINSRWDDLIKLANSYNQPFETPLHRIYEDEICLSSIPSLSMHCANINSIFGIPPNTNWEKLWEEAKYD